MAQSCLLCSAIEKNKTDVMNLDWLEIDFVVPLCFYLQHDSNLRFQGLNRRQLKKNNTLKR